MERGQLLEGLDPFGDGRDAHRLGKADHGGDDGGIAGVAAQAGDEGAVDLQEVDGELLEVVHGREPGPEVVQRQPDAERLQAHERASGGVQVLHHRTLGDLEPEVGRRKA